VIALLVVALTSVAAGADVLRGARRSRSGSTTMAGPTPHGNRRPDSTSRNLEPSPSRAGARRCPASSDRLELATRRTLAEAGGVSANFEVRPPADDPGAGEPLVVPRSRRRTFPGCVFVWVAPTASRALLLTEFKAHPYRPYIREESCSGGGTGEQGRGERRAGGYWLSGRRPTSSTTSTRTASTSTIASAWWATRWCGRAATSPCGWRARDPRGEALRYARNTAHTPLSPRRGTTCA
jgi:hypothetical protein